MSDEERQLDELFTAYRRACAAPEPSPRFLPDIWNKIEARRSMTLSLRRWTGAFVTAAALCLAVAAYRARPLPAESPVYTTTYVDTLEGNQSFETLAYAELVSYGSPESPEGR